jgi:predicted DNA-binding protein (MmcQ/YjbR family)
MFALCNMNTFQFVNLKCDPERAIELREEHSYIQPGYHMSKVHWNSVYLNQGIKLRLLRDLIDHSYELVFSSLTKKLQSEILSLD